MNKNITSIAIFLLLAVITGCEPTREVTNFEQCAQAGNPVMESYPMQCRTADGRTFVQSVSAPVVPVPMPVPGVDVPETVVEPASGSTSPSLIHDLPVPPAVDAARNYIMEKVGAQRSEVIVLEAFVREWPDSCLGAAGLDGTLDLEVCAEMIVPGYEIKINAKGKEYQLRTNGDGSVIREISAVDAEEMITIQ